MLKIRHLLLCLLLIVASVANAQNKTVTGIVTSESDGEPMPGVSILVKGTSKGAITDIEGNYSITVSGDGAVLRFSFIGMETTEVKVGSKSILNVTLKSSSLQMDEVVVTAMGMSKKTKSLGYSVTKVSGDELTAVKETNVINSLAGKVAGVNITQQSGSVGGSSKIIIRGATSLSGNNQPLFVIDGMPISNSSYGNGIEGAVDYGNAAGDINSMDIESLNILKGAAATALYGARAKNGAIIITTKKGKDGVVDISYSGSIRLDQIAKLPEYQNEYAQGLDGNYLLKNFNGWGPKLNDVSGQKFEDFLGDQIPLKAYDNNVKDFFDTGVTQIHNFAISGGNDKSDYRLSYTLTNQKGIIPQSELKKNDISFNAGRKLNNFIETRFSGSYSRSLRDGLSAQGSNDPNVIIGSILGMPRTTDIQKLKDNTYNETTGIQNSWDGQGKTNNPYFILDNNKITGDTERFYGNGNITIKPTSWLQIKNQTGIDFSTQSRRTIWAVETIGEKDGKFKDDVYRTRIFNNDLIATANWNLNEDFKLNALVGHNIYQREYDRKSNEASELIVAGIYNYSNVKTNVPTNYQYLKRLWGLYSEINLDYKDMLFLTLTGRNDWSSTLPEENNSYFYPSASLGYIFTKSFDTPDWFNFGKIRLNWANVGSDEDPYQLQFQYSGESTWFSQYGSGGTFPHQGVSAFSIPRTYPNLNLKPQNQTSYEIGTDLRFFNNRITIDATYYVIDTKDQIVSIDVPLSTGFFAKKINAGLVKNKGFEVQLGLTPVKTNNIEWLATFNFSTNKNTVKELYGNLKDYTLTSGWSGLQIKAIPGEAFSLYGTAWKRNKNGDIIINKETGLREITPSENLGKIDPDFRLGFTNAVKIKNFTINATIDWRQGGKMFSGTVASLRSAGLVEETLAHRGETFVDAGVNEIGTGDNTTYAKNTTPVKSMQEYWGNISATSNTEGNVFDASYMKLREVSITYTLPKSILANNGIIKNVTVGIEGRNLWNIIDNVPHVDPELNFFGPGEIGGGVEFNSVPMSRTYGFNCKLNF